ncbi:MAG: hypothetical protein JWO36_4745 [Myxococcales bacterium]|nr:hypothetical protein [Myxococcales bacterium]
MESYASSQIVQAPRSKVFDAITSRSGLQGWWTPLVDGAGELGTEWVFGFEGVDEQIVMRIDETQTAERVRWTCVRHSGLPDWNGTEIVFDLVEHGPDACDLRLRHLGLTPALECFDSCQLGWDHFLASISAFVESGTGMPYRA